MRRQILILLIAAFACIPSFAQDTAATGKHLRVSLLTCGPGDEEVYEVFGHTGVRVIDSANNTDEVYNYGTFAFGPDFELQFMQGKLLYYVSKAPFMAFMEEYIIAKRSVEEQVLLIDDHQARHIYDFLEWNAEPENREYKYDFFFDNCATRIRDIFPRPDVLGKNFKYGKVVSPDKPLTFRDIINQYFFRDHWTRVGVNILLGSKIDRVMTNDDIMFLPDYLRDGLGGATVSGRKIATAPTLLLPAMQPQSAGLNQPMIVTGLIAILTIIGLSFPQLRVLGKVMSSLVLFATGLLGCLILVMWFATDHQGCSNNFNILWCLPTNIVIAFANPKGKPRYALIAIVLLFVSFLLHLFKVQGLTLLELGPLFLALLVIYGTIYKRSRVKNNDNA